MLEDIEGKIVCNCFTVDQTFNGVQEEPPNLDLIFFLVSFFFVSGFQEKIENS